MRLIVISDIVYNTYIIQKNNEGKIFYFKMNFFSTSSSNI